MFCRFLFDRRIAFCALLVEHCSVSHEVLSLFPASALFYDGNYVRLSEVLCFRLVILDALQFFFSIVVLPSAHSSTCMH